jgi:hypothetical protein
MAVRAAHLPAGTPRPDPPDAPSVDALRRLLLIGYGTGYGIALHSASSAPAHELSGGAA